MQTSTTFDAFKNDTLIRLKHFERYAAVFNILRDTQNVEDFLVEAHQQCRAERMFDNGAGGILWDIYKTAIKVAVAELENWDGVTYWRGTNRRAEFAEVAAGLQILSLNHVANTYEPGMSVNSTPCYIAVQGYKYGYQVTGEICGTGSDGEPVLRNCKVVGKILTNQGVAKKDRARLTAVQAFYVRIEGRTNKTNWSE